MLKKKSGQHIIPHSVLPPVNEQGQFLDEPTTILERRLVKKEDRPIPEIRVKWMNMSPEESTCEDYDKIIAQFPQLDP